MMTRFAILSACRLLAPLLAAAASPAFAQQQPAPEPAEETEIPAEATVPPREAPLPDTRMPSALQRSQPLTAAGSRAGENPVRQASDAFGTVVGREAVGLYNDELVRGFSPLAAGNVRLDGLYFDAVIVPTDRTSGATNILIGPSVIGVPFPAPSGIVDFELRLPGQEFAASGLFGVTSFGEVRGEMDLALPVTDRLSVGLGATLEWLREGDGRRDNKFEGSVMVNWEPTDRLQIIPFLSLAYTPLDDITPIYVPAGDFLPPRLPRRTRIGPDWSFRDDVEINTGGIMRWGIADGWDFKFGIFRSETRNPEDGENLMEDVQPDGSARHIVLRDPSLFFGSLSGEARLQRTIEDGPRLHRLLANFRGRDSVRRFDGSAEVDLGPTRIDRITRVPPPATLEFDTQQRDKVKQWFAGLAYMGRWEGVGELDVGVQYTDFRKRIGVIGEVPDAIDTRKWLFNVGLAIELSPTIEIFGGYVNGLEESGIAPGNADNRNEALPAIPTRQFDFGLRWKIAEELRLIAGAFQLSKPYFSIDNANIFRELGDLRNRGFETSLAGMVTPELSLNIGMLLLDPAVRGEAVEAGISGPRAVGGLARRIEASADWRPPFIPGVSFDLEVSHRSPETATVNNLVEIPTRTLVAIGGRRFFAIGGNEAMLRVQIDNLFDKQGFELVDAGAYQLIWPRRFLAYLTVDF
ncbi:MAG: TonB-dependent receptor [Sphingomonadaceae bacterium]